MKDQRFFSLPKNVAKGRQIFRLNKKRTKESWSILPSHFFIFHVLALFLKGEDRLRKVKECPAGLEDPKGYRNRKKNVSIKGVRSDVVK